MAEDNSEVTLLPNAMFVRIIDCTLAAHIADATTIDSFVKQTLQTLNSDIPPHLHSCLADFQHRDNLLTYQNRMYIPPTGTLCREVVSRCHDHVSAGHPGFLKTRQLMAADYWWPGLAQVIWKYVEGCGDCQQAKANTHLTVPPLNPIRSSASRPFQQLSCDLITDLPPSSGFDSLLVMVDHGLTKGVILCPTKKTATAEGITTLFFHKVYTRFDLYEKIISDRGPQFASAFAKELGKLLGYTLALSTAYHPQTDGETERVNQEVETYLRIYCGNNPTSWADSISHAEFAHNHRPHSVTGKSPFYLMMGYEPVPLPNVLPSSPLPAVEERLKALQAARLDELARQTMAARTRRHFTLFKKGERVWLEARNLKRNVANPKFTPKREGPFTIIDVLSPITYRLHLPQTWNIHLVFHASLLSPYRENTVHGPNFPKPPPDLITGEEEYKIDRILRHYGISQNRSFLIRWKGYSAEEDSWIPEANLSHATKALQEYKTLHPSAFPPRIRVVSKLDYHSQLPFRHKYYLCTLPPIATIRDLAGHINYLRLRNTGHGNLTRWYCKINYCLFHDT